MLKPNNAAKKTARHTQLRGLELERRIEEVIRELAAQVHKKADGTKFTYNATQVAKSVPTTRRTLAKHEELVTRVLSDLDARRRMVDGSATLFHLQEQIEYLKEQLLDRDKTINGLRSYHGELYRLIYTHVPDAGRILIPSIEKKSWTEDGCLFCGSKTHIRQREPKGSNIISLKPTNSTN